MERDWGFTLIWEDIIFCSGDSLRANLPIERRGSNVYIQVIFDQFGETLYKAGAYVLDELELNICLHLDFTVSKC